jgi:hypothetical protein
MKWWLIKLDDGDPVPHYLAKEGQGAGFAWTPIMHAARRFTSAEDAESFVTRRMPHLGVTVVAHPEG